MPEMRPAKGAPTLQEEQAELERDMVRRGKDRYDRARRDAEEKGANMRTPSFQVVHRTAMQPLTEAIESFLQGAAEKKIGRRVRSALFISKIVPEAAAYITLTTLLGAVGADGKALYGVSRELGRAIEVEAYFTKQTLEDREGTRRRLKRISERQSTTEHRKKVLNYAVGDSTRAGHYEAWGIGDVVHTGIKLIEMMIQSTGLMEVGTVTARRGRKTTTVLRPTARMVAWMGDLDLQMAATRPKWLPTLIPPKDWNGMRKGGYHTDAFLMPPSFIRNPHKGQKEAIAAIPPTEHMRAVNAIQQTAWQINKSVLEIALEMVAQGSTLAGLPDLSAEPLPTPPADFAADPEITRTWKQEAWAAHARNSKAQTKRWGTLSALTVAQEFANRGAIYFPHQCDFRGRIYPIPTNLTPQGTDLQKGLLRFADGAPLGSLEGARWFEIHGANCYGIDKVSFPKRQAWVAENAENILASAAAPLDFLWWTGADEPFQFLAWCFEYAEWKAQGFDLGYVSRVPVAMDGSCNGIQHYSAMLLDPKGGKATNLVPGDDPQDLYKEVAAEARKMLEEWTGEGQDYASFWLSQGLDRSMCKPVVIAYSFGGTNDGAYRTVLSDMTERGVQHPNLSGACSFLAKIIMDSARAVCEGAEAAFTWLRNLARQQTELNEAVAWTTPSGFPVVQRYTKTSQKRLKIVLLGRQYQPASFEETDAIDPRKQAAGLAPNLVQSLDAAHLAKTVSSASSRGLRQYAMVHDSYGCPAGDAPLLAATLREEFARMYSTPLLREFKEQAAPEWEEPLPATGGLDIDKVKGSSYFFS